MVLKIVLITLVALLAVLSWAPWLTANEAAKIVQIAHPDIGNRFQSDPGCGTVEVNWFLLGKWVGDCEGGYIVGFWGKIIGDK